MITADIQDLEPGEKVQLFELDASGIGGDYFRFHGYQTGDIWWQGKEYSAWPIQAEGFARTGEAQQPAPVLTLGNVDGSISALCVYFDDLVGAKLFRHTTLGKYLDAKNFPDGNPTADPNEAFPSELWYIEQKKAESNDVIQFELSSALDFNGVKLPRRQIVANVCWWLDLLYDSYLKKWVLQNPAKGIAIDSVPAGSVHYFAMQTAPDGYLVANGAHVSRTVYARLFSAIGTTFGEGDGGSTFQLPDLRGEFLRGWDAARNLDPERGFGTAQGDAIRNITGQFGADDREVGACQGAFFNAGWGDTGSSGSGSGYIIGFDASRLIPTSNENRPHNMALLACIKY